MSEQVLQVRDLEVHFRTRGGVVRAVNKVSFDLKPGERFGLVGESGSGKSTLVLSILRLIKPPGYIVGGEISLDGRDLLALSDEAMRQTRLADIALIPQAAMDSLNPVIKIKNQFRLVIRDHLGGNHRQSWDEYKSGSASSTWEDRVIELLRWVGLDPGVAELYPHELSGGMKQRVCIALGIALRPRIILADEPTSALDVVVQRQVMETLEAVQERLGATVLLIGHDMGLMAQAVDRIGVMYGGRLVEIGPVGEVFQEPLHPYTQLLIASLPSFESKGQLIGIPGMPLSLLDPPGGCLFHPRCPQALAHCATQVPDLQEVRPGRWVACHLYEHSQGGSVAV